MSPDSVEFVMGLFRVVVLTLTGCGAALGFLTLDWMVREEIRTRRAGRL